MEIKEAAERYLEILKELHAYDHAMGVLSYDAVTGAPARSAKGRGETLEYFSRRELELRSGTETLELVRFLLAHKEELEPMLRRSVEEYYREYEYIANVPPEEYVAHQVLLNEADAVWHKAKAENDFAAFAPYLERIVHDVRRFALLYKPDAQPYDVLLDRFERGLTMEKADAFFAALRERLVPLLQRVTAAKQLDDGFLWGSFPTWKQQILSDRVMVKMGIDRERCSIGVTEHPFTTGFNLDDVRITTNYREDNFTQSMYSVIHEGGHALYDMGSDPALEEYGLAGGASMGVHESQSRFYENLIGRSRAFCVPLLRIMKEVFPERMKDVTEDELYEAVNLSKPSLIRTEADELTYSLHVMIRYELERAMVGGDLDVCDVPGEWNRLYKEVLGVDVPDDRRGALQDSHWSGGGMGYFPSYALGSAYGVQMLRQMEKDADIWSAVAAGDLSPVTAWLTEKVHQYGSLKKPRDLLPAAMGGPLDASVYTGYLKKKFGELYRL